MAAPPSRRPPTDRCAIDDRSRRPASAPFGSTGEPGDGAGRSHRRHGPGFRIAALVVAVVALLAGCAATLRSQVSTFHELPPGIAGQPTFAVVPTDDGQAQSLEFRRYATLVTERLRARGWVPVEAGEARYQVALSWRVGPGRSIVNADPYWGPYGAWGGLGWGYGSRRGSALGFGMPLGGWPADIRTAYLRELRFTIDRRIPVTGEAPPEHPGDVAGGATGSAGASRGSAAPARPAVPADRPPPLPPAPVAPPAATLPPAAVPRAAEMGGPAENADKMLPHGPAGLGGPPLRPGTAGLERVYEATVRSEGASADPAVVLPAMIQALFAEFPGPSGRVRTVDVPLEDVVR